MTRRGELKDVALGVLGSFVSRNNDVDGYWCLGLLRALADAQRVSTAAVTPTAARIVNASATALIVVLLA